MILLECIIAMSVAYVCWEYAKNGVTVSIFTLSLIPVGIMGYYFGWWACPLVWTAYGFCEWGYQSMRIGAVRSSDVYTYSTFQWLMRNGVEDIHLAERDTFDRLGIEELERICSVG